MFHYKAWTLLYHTSHSLYKHIISHKHILIKSSPFYLIYFTSFATVVSYALVDIIEDTYLKYAKYVVGPVFDPKAASCEGKVYMVTGCNTGIGYVISDIRGLIVDD